MTPGGRFKAIGNVAMLAAGLSTAGCSLSSGRTFDGLRGVFEPIAFMPAGMSRAQAAAVVAPPVAEPAEPRAAALPAAVAAVPGPQGEQPQGGRLLGESSSVVLRLLGKPALRRTEAPGEVWQYVAGACVIHLFLYRGEQGGEHRVQHVEAATRGLVPTDAAACLGEVRLRRQAEAAKS